MSANGQLRKSQKNKCAFCGLTLRPTDLIEFEHIISRSKGGNNRYKKKQVLHSHCHDTKIALDNKNIKNQN